MVIFLHERSNIIPVHAESYFIVERNGKFNQILKYQYYDPEEYYYTLIHRPREYYKEIKRLYCVMNEVLKEERVLINGKQVKLNVKLVNIDFAGYVDQPYILYYIKFKGPLRKGVNIFEDFYEETVAEYDYEVYWFFPERTKILEVYVDGDFDLVNSNKLFIWARKGDKISGYEKIIFMLS